MIKNMIYISTLSLVLGACGGGGGSSAQTGAGDEVNEGDSGASNPIEGAWVEPATNPTRTFFTFFADGTYVHVHQPEFSNEETGLEWGIYSRSGTDGRISAQPRFDENGGTGLSGSDLDIFIDPSDNGIVVTWADSTESGTFPLFSTGMEGIQGSWRNTDTSTQLEMLNFNSDGVYTHARVDNDVNSLTSGAEQGTYTWDASTGELTTQINFDMNADAGLSGYQSPAKLFLTTANNLLTLSVDSDGNGVTDDELVFARDETQENDGYTRVTETELTTLYGKRLTLVDEGFIVVNGDGTFAGTWSSEPIAGTWEMRDDYFCRVLTQFHAPDSTGTEDCQLWELSGDGDTIRAARDRGNGSSWIYEVTQQ